MSILIESLKRLYKNKQITKEKVYQLEKEKKITNEEMVYILGK